MFTTVALVATHAAAAVGAVFAWPHISALYASFKASRAVKDAQAIVAQAEAAAAALEAARKVIAAQPKPVAATGPTGAKGA